MGETVETLTYDLSDGKPDEFDFKCAINGKYYYYFIEDFSRYLRSFKHRELEAKQHELLDEIKEAFYQRLEDNKADVDFY